MSRPDGCQATTEAIICATGEKMAICCVRGWMHDGDHVGRFDGYGMTLTWPRVESAPFVVKLTGGPLPPKPAWNAACVIKAQPFPIIDAGPHPKDGE